MYYKDENNKRICYVYSDCLTGPYNEPENKSASAFDEDTEGCCMYKLAGTDKWAMIMDSYSLGNYVMQTTTDFVNFVPVAKGDYFLDFSPRHGSMLLISDDEYDRIKKHFEG